MLSLLQQHETLKTQNSDSRPHGLESTYGTRDNLTTTVNSTNSLKGKPATLSHQRGTRPGNRRRRHHHLGSHQT